MTWWQRNLKAQLTFTLKVDAKQVMNNTSQYDYVGSYTTAVIDKKVLNGKDLAYTRSWMCNMGWPAFLLYGLFISPKLEQSQLHVLLFVSLSMIPRTGFK